MGWGQTQSPDQLSKFLLPGIIILIPLLQTTQWLLELCGSKFVVQFKVVSSEESEYLAQFKVEG